MSDASEQPAPSGTVSSPVDFVALGAGRMIGRYEVVSVLGQGGFGITYRAHDSQLDREVAIKEYLPLALAVRQDGTTVLPRSTDAAADFTWGRERFVAEGRTLASLQRAPAIVRVFDFLEANGTAYIVMELLSGETLEHRLKRLGPMGPADIDRILWPLLDGLEQVHATGFLHRDIKPANILLDSQGNPTLIDFGASRAAMAGRSTALTAVFTPGYAAAEQMTSAKQGPWTDIYGLSATLYHAITGQTPPGAFDRMLDDHYEPLGARAREGFSAGLLKGIDTGLAVRAGDRPQAIGEWRQQLGRAAASDAHATVLLGRPTDGSATVVSRPAVAAAPPAAAAKRGKGLWLGLAAAGILVVAGGYYGLMEDRRPVSVAAPATAPAVAEPDKAIREAQAAAEAKRLQDQEELVKLRAEAEARQKHEAEAAARRQIEEETRLKIEAEQAERKRLDEEARQKAEADAAARQKAVEEDKKAAEAAEVALHLTTVDRQHVQVALTALGYATNGTDGAFGPRTRDMIAAWQKSSNAPETGFLSGAQNQALLRDAAPAIAKFDDERKKAAEVQAKPATIPPPAVPPQVAAAVPPPAASAAASGVTDGVWQGSYTCEAGGGGNGGNPEAFGFPLRIGIKGGTGTWTNPGTRGTLSVTVQISGTTA